jgi:hypothetical protein
VGQGPPTTHPATTRKQPDPVAWLFTDGGVPYEFLLTPGSASTASQVNFFQFSPFAERCRYSLGPVVDALFAVPISCKQSPNGVLDVSQMSYRDKCFSIFVGLCLSLIVKARVFPAYTESFHAPTADSLGPSFQVGERLLFDLENPIELLKIVEHYLLAIVENESADSTIRALATSVICVIAQTKSTVEAVVNSTPSCRLNANRQRIYAAVPQSQSQLQLHRDAMGRVISAAQDLLAIIQALFRSTDANFNISDWFFLIMGKILQGRDFWLEDDGLDAVLATKADVRTILDCLIKSLSPAELGQVAHD